MAGELPLKLPVCGCSSGIWGCGSTCENAMILFRMFSTGTSTWNSPTKG